MSRPVLAVALALTLWAPSALAQGRVPIAVMDLAGRGVDEAAAGALTTEVGNTLAQLRVFQVITREDIKRMLQLEQTKQQCTGSVDAACMAEIGGALGVDYLVYGDVSKIANVYSVSLVLLDISKAQATNRVSRKISEAGLLLAEAEQATKLLVQPLLADKKGYLVLDARERGAQVKLDGRLIGITPLAGRLEVAMGAHEILIEKEGYLAYAKTVDVPPNQALVEPVSLVPSQAFIEDYAGRNRVLRGSAWATAGVGAALLGTGLALKLVSDARFDDLVNKNYLTQNSAVCSVQNPSYNGSNYCATAEGYAHDVTGTVDSIETQDSVALGLAISGVVSAVASVVLFMVSEDPDRYEAYGAGGGAAAVSAGPDGAQVMFRW